MRKVVLGLMWLVSCHCAVHGGLIYVVPSHGDQSSCPATSNSETRCLTMNEMWGDPESGGWVPVSDTTLSFLPGRHVVNFSCLIEFRDISNITLTATEIDIASETLTEIYCSKPAGFYFLNVTRLTISHLVFTKCGIDSVGRDLIKNTFQIYANSFFLFDSLERMALTMASVSDLSLSGVTVQNSSGYGLLIINVFGNSIIENSKFVFSNYYTYSSTLCNGTFETADSFYICAGANIGIGFVDPPQCINRDNPPVYSLNITSTITANGINLTPFAIGSGIVIAMSQTAYGMHVYMDNVTSFRNVARNGANLAFLIYDVVDNSSVTIKNSFSGYSNPLFRPSVLTILSGTQFVGGGLFFSYGRRLPSRFRPSCEPWQKHSHSNLLTVTDMEFVGNNAILGGAMNIDFRSSADVGIVSLISVTNCLFRDNIGSPGSALYINQLQPIENVLLAQFLFENCTFQNNTYPLMEIPNSIQQFELDLLNAVQLISVQYSSFIDCSFEDNVGSALYGYASLLRFSGSIRFVRNSGVNGGGMSLHGSSIMLLTPNTTVTFLNNSAQFRGGGMFISSENYRTSLLCFWQLESSTMNNETVGPELVLPINQSVNNLNVAEQLNIQVIFSGNRASSAGNAIYGGVVDRCFFLPTADVITDRSSRRIFDQMFIFQGSDNDMSLISSDPSRICICNHTKPMCDANNPNITLFPGQAYEVYAIAIGQRNGTSPGVVFGGFLRDRTRGTEAAALQTFETAQQLGQNCTRLSYTILSTKLNTDLQLLLALENSNVQSNPTIVTIRLLPCPPGFNLSTDPPSCQCHPSLAKHVVTCDITTETVHRVPPMWFSRDLNNFERTGNSLLVYDYCPFDYCIPDEVDTNLSQADTLCAFNRSGIVCGGCQSGFSLTLGTNECEVCTNSYLALLIPFAIAGLLLVILLLLFNSLTVSVGAINGLIFYANILQLNKGIFFPPGHSNPMTTFIAWLNLDLGIKTCFYDGMDQYAKTWLQFVFPIYLWILIGIIILLGRYLSSVAKLLGDKAVPVLATVFLLSMAKLQRTIIIGLSFATVEHSDGRHTTVWYFDANIEYLQGKHIYLFVLSLATVLFIMLPFVFSLMFVTCLQSLSAHRLFHWVNHCKPLIDAYNGPYKDKYRYWTGFLLFARGIILIVFSVVDPRVTLLLITASMQLLSAFTWIGGGVYKQWPLNALEFSFFANLGILSAATLFVQYAGGYQEGAIYTSTTIAFLQFLGIVTFAVYLQLNSYFKWNIDLDSIKEKFSKFAPASRKRAVTDSRDNPADENMNLSPSRKFFLAESADLEVVINRGDSNSLEGTCSVTTELREPLLESGRYTV